MPSQTARKSITPGALVYRFRKTFEHGLRTAYYRDWVRPRILRTPPVISPENSPCEIHVLTSSNDWLNLVWTLKTFYRVAGTRYALCIHDDGSLPERAVASLREHFPFSRFIARAEADRAVPPALAAYPLCLQLRRTNTLSLKLFDFAHYLRADRMLLLDSDILFFTEPTEFLRRIDDSKYALNTVNADVGSAYTTDAAAVRERFGFELQPAFNSGLGLIHRDSMRLDWIEEFLSLPGILGHFWRIEQTLFALCSFRYGAELLPEEYRVQLSGETTASCKHYVGAIRHHMYGRGIPALVQSGFLREPRR